MNFINKQTGIFSHRQLKSCYRYKDIFQILPVNVSDDIPLNMDYPLIIEARYSSDIWPKRDINFWFRDSWEMERWKTIQNKHGKEIDFSSEWGKAYEQETKYRRSNAIFEEIINLLTLFTNHRFFSYRNDQRWFTTFNHEKNESNQHWGSIGYKFNLNATNEEKLSDISKYNDIKKVDSHAYNHKIRDAIYVGEHDQEITFPNDIDSLFNLYFDLNSDDMKQFYSACKLYVHALELKGSHPSLSLVSSAAAIEALNKDIEKITCTECGSKPSMETCDECGLPRHRISSKFKQFFSDYGSDSNEFNKFAKSFYSFRSNVAHGGLLRADHHDSGFYASDNDEQEQFCRNSLIVVQKLLLNWLIKHPRDNSK